ncbi:MAG: protein-disulfide reductase DsbD family protein, partial [Asticcacaulis sp.]
SADVSLSLPIADGPAKPDPVHGKALTRMLAEAPKPSAIEARITPSGTTGRMSLSGSELTGRDLNGAYFFANQGRQVVHTAAQSVEQGEAGLSLGLTLDKGFKAPLHGVLALADGTAFEITATAGAPLPMTSGQTLRDAAALDAEKAEANQAAGLFPEGAAGLWLAAGAAFLGGLILNLMPCVFPVLSMKATALVRSGGDLSEARLHGLMFLAGVLVTFLGLAGILIAARAAGEAAGWGFQLQSPFATGALALLMLAVALNMSKVFEAGLSVQSAGSELQAKGGLMGAFFTGALAVVVAAPCSAPFMAGAVGFALVQPALISLGIFAALGFGFALPFVLLSLTPPLLRALPRPGPWMDGFRKIMAFPMYGAAGWMLWVFAEQTGSLALANLLTSALVLAFGLYLFGVWQRQRAVGQGGLVALTASALSVAGALSLMVSGALMAPVPASGPVKAAPGKLESRPFTPQALAALRAEGRPVLVNLTAAWCVTCKVNEQVALETRDVEQALKRTGTAYLVGDWTNRDDMIAAELARHGRSGVPLYLVYPAGGGAPEILPQLLTPGLVVKALERAETPVRKP